MKIRPGCLRRVLITSMPSAVNTASKTSVNFVSRSRSRNRCPAAHWSRSISKSAVYTPISARIIVAAALGTALLAALWWIYFGTTASYGERVLVASGRARRAALARDAYGLLHLPMVAGIVLVSFGLGKTMSVLGSHGLFDGAPVYQLPHLALFGGVIIYLLVDLAFRWRLARRAHRQRIVQTLVVIALVPATASLPGLTALAILAAVCVGFIAIEVVRGERPAPPEPRPVLPD